MRSIDSNAPAMAMNMVDMPQVFVKESWTSSLRKRPNNNPSIPPARMEAQLMIVPKPIIIKLTFLKTYLYPSL
jgi:hypothetical protein